MPELDIDQAIDSLTEDELKRFARDLVFAVAIQWDLDDALSVIAEWLEE